MYDMSIKELRSDAFLRRPTEKAIVAERPSFKPVTRHEPVALFRRRHAPVDALVAPSRRIDATGDVPRLLAEVAIHAQVVSTDGVRDAPALQVVHRVANRPHGIRHVDTHLGERHRVGRCDLAAERDHRVLDLAFDRIAGERIALEVAVEQIGADEIGDLVRMAERDEFRGLLHFLSFQFSGEISGVSDCQSQPSPWTYSAQRRRMTSTNFGSSSMRRA